MRKILMTLALVVAFACPVPVHAQEAPAADKPAVTAPAEVPAEAPAEAPKEEKAPIVTGDEAKKAGGDLVEGVKEILKAPKTGDWKKDYLYPLIALLVTVLLALAATAGLRHGMPYLRAKAKKAGIELDAEKEKMIISVIDDAIVLSEATALKRLRKDPENKTASEKKAKDAVSHAKSTLAILGIGLAEDAITNRLNSRHLVLSADPKSPINNSGS